MAKQNGKESSGNTNTSDLAKKTYKKYTNWCLTLWDISETEILKKMNYKYIIMGKEICPETGRLHYQSFIVLKNARSFNSIKKELPRANFRHCKGSAASNYNYCSKDGNLLFEDGRRPYERIGIKELKEMSYTDLIDHDARCHKAYFHAKEFLEADLTVENFRKKNMEVLYIQGPSGIGKTEKALEIIEERKETFNNIKYENGFYSGTGGESKIALYDDFRDNHMKPSEFINLIDYNVHNMNVKGGQKCNKYNLIIITSVQKLSNLYKGMHDEEPKKQWMRRIKVIDMFPDDHVEETEDLDLGI